MSLVEILKLVGFGTGAILHLYIAWLIRKRRALPNPDESASTPRDQTGLTNSESAFVLLGLVVGAWFLGNLLVTLQELVVGPERLTGLLRISNTIAVIGIALFPSALLHSHLAFWNWLDGYRVMSRSRVRAFILASYIPMIVLPYTVYLVNTGPYTPYLTRLTILLTPYSIWYLLASLVSASIDWRMRNRLYPSAARERVFLGLLALELAVTGVFEFVVVGVLHSNPNDQVWIIYILLSLLPTFTIAYFIYRYGLYALAIKGSLVYATFAILFLAVYTYGVRRVDRFLVGHFDVRPGVAEAVLILGMFALARPAVRVIDRAVRALFSREMELYRDVVRQMTSPARALDGSRPSASTVNSVTGPGASRDVEPPEVIAGLPPIDPASAAQGLDLLVEHARGTIQKGLGLGDVRILPLNLQREGSRGSALTAVEMAVAERLQRSGARRILADEDPDIASIPASAALALRHSGRLVGLILIGPGGSVLTPERIAVLEVLAGQIAIGIETWWLTEEKIELERQLSRRERLAALGQMAATIAHEVKNPLSAIKSIAQVMREDIKDDGVVTGPQTSAPDPALTKGPEARETDALRTGHSSLTPPTGWIRDLDMIVMEIDRLNRTVSQLLTFSRGDQVSTNGSAGAAGTVSIGELVGRSAAVMEPNRREQQVRLDIHLEQDTFVAEGLSSAFREILDNLLLNALQASEPGGSVSLELSLSESEMVIEVLDNGPGIPEQDRERIFEPFFTTRPRGTGLGLAIVKKRVGELAGSIAISSPLPSGPGAKFRITIPLNASSRLSLPSLEPAHSD